MELAGAFSPPLGLCKWILSVCLLRQLEMRGDGDISAAEGGIRRNIWTLPAPLRTVRTELPPHESSTVLEFLVYNHGLLRI
jgi:hypothetical protein